MKPSRSTTSPRRHALLALLALALLPALPAFARGTAEEAWQPVSGEEIWRHEIDLTEVPPGTHNVIIRARDLAGNETLEGPYNVRVDPAVGLPVVRVVYPERGAVLRDDVSVIGVASGSSGVARVVLRLNEGPPVFADGTEYWGRTISAAGLPDGAYTLHARAVDDRGAEGPTVTVPFVLDRSAPEVTITSHRPGELVNGNITIQGNADDANGIVGVELSTDDGLTYEPLRLRTSRGSTGVSFSFSVQTRRIPDGATVYHLRATDTTGATAIHPVLFFVDNEAPTLEILAPQPDEAVFGRVRITGMVSDTVGVDRLFYEWNRAEQDIPLRPGDPYWTTDIDISGERGRSVSIRFTAVDRSGNRTSLVHRLQNDVAASLSNVELLHPDAEVLTALSGNDAIYGQVKGGGQPDAVVVEGSVTGEYPAGPGFRIPASDIPVGRGELRIRARSADGTLGNPLRVRVTRLPEAEDALVASPSEVTVTGISAYQYIHDSFLLEGRVSTAAVRLEYRLSPDDPWQTVTVSQGGEPVSTVDTDDSGEASDSGEATDPGTGDEDESPSGRQQVTVAGSFSIPVRVSSLPEGPVHLELRTITAGRGNAPVYLPINHSPGAPNISVTSPRPSDVINGLVTVSGAVCSRVPVAELAYTLDGETFVPLEVTPTCVGNAFVFPVDFSALQEAGGRLQIRVTDVAGNVHTETPPIRIDRSGDLPVVELNLPQDGDVVTDSFAISGMAFDDDGVAAVFWRIGEGEFRRIAVTQSFRIDVALDEVSSGEQAIEVYAEDIYGLTGETVSVSITGSIDRPVVEVLEPGRDKYNRGTVVLRGTASDLNGIESVRLSMDNGNSFQTADGTEQWSLSLNTGAYRDGSYSMLVVASDTLGVESRVTALISIDNTPPVVSLADPEDGRLAGRSLVLSGRVEDNVEVDTILVELLSVDSGDVSLTVNLAPGAVVLETLDVSELPAGNYTLRLMATDLAGNASVVTRNVELSTAMDSYRAALFSPMPGVTHTGPLAVTGQVSGPDTPAQVRIFDGDVLVANAEVDRTGFFHHELAATLLRGRSLSLTARFETASGETVSSPVHAVRLEQYGPVVVIDSHRSGEMVSGRPWLRGRAWVEATPTEMEQLSGRRGRRPLDVERVLVSFDNGRTFEPARGGEEWQFRLETVELSRGPLPVVVRAEFADGRSAVTRVILTVDTAAPLVTLISPQEESRHANTLSVYGTASDEYGLAGIEVALRPGDKSGYAVPQFIQGLYLDSHFLGATYADLGLGISFFDNNVKLQVQAGIAPPGRFTGTVIGSKLLANVLVLPFDYFFGPDWSFFSMAFALGANFSYFTMDEDTSGLVMSAVLAQWEFARFEFAERTMFRNVSLYVEPNFWFASSDVEAGTVFRLSFGLRTGIL